MTHYNDSTENAGQEIKAKLKWFNPTKGFGFVSPLDGSADAFLHVSVLHRAGMQHINEQAELLCEIGRGPKGPQVITILEVLSEGISAGEAVAASPRTRDAGDDTIRAPLGPEKECGGVVKWFKPDKGFGFVTIDGSEQDVFVHKSVLQRSGLFGLEPGQHVLMRIQEVEKGREATWITIA